MSKINDCDMEEAEMTDKEFFAETIEVDEVEFKRVEEVRLVDGDKYTTRYTNAGNSAVYIETRFYDMHAVDGNMFIKVIYRDESVDPEDKMIYRRQWVYYYPVQGFICEYSYKYWVTKKEDTNESTATK